MLYELWEIGAIVMAILIAARSIYLILAVIGFVPHKKWTIEAMTRFVALRVDGKDIFGRWDLVATAILMTLLFTVMIALWPITLIFILSN